MLDQKLIADVQLPGLRPTQQQRSRELVVRLMTEGLELLREHDFESLSIETLCARCDATVGSFYGRFENKEAFVDALQRVVVEDARRELAASYASGKLPRDSLAHLLNWIAKGGVAWIRRYEGLVRASLRRASTDRKSWTPMRELGRLHVEYALPHIVRLVGPRAAPGLEERVRLAFQMMYGTLNTMVLIDPGPLSLGHPETPRRLAAALQRLIE
ncbi:MAG: TetR/AcrR family transcriptional regulator [Reyranella sp.]|uniref:TetR/AcrR family transcriptional regulator n=1 Tax=Reyranella sp. TaxID=1929291 RepID=UPI001ACDF89D|nr:TetR/AcrR family transcriptional regulator [Reyranella sp.]MBN9090482.1 TetR/AcrR family transcriptional regulator [Reyranella sp.]